MRLIVLVGCAFAFSLLIYGQCRTNMDNLRAQDEQQRRALAVQYLIAHPIVVVDNAH